VETGLLPTDEQLLKEYFPRVIKPGSIDALMESLEKGDPTGEFTSLGNELRGFEEAQKRKGKTVAKGDRLAHIAKVLNTGNYQFISKPGAAKDRALMKVANEQSQFYENSADALISHIFDMTQAIEKRSFLGKQNLTRPQEMAKLDKVVRVIDRIDEITPDKRTEAEVTERSNLFERYNELYENLSSIDKDLENSVAAYVLEEIGANNPKTKELVHLIRARLTERGTHGIVGAVRDVGYMMTLGSPLSAITQIGDLTWSAYANGPLNTAAAIFSSLPHIFSKDKGLTKEFFDFSNSLGDFSKDGISNAGTQQILDKVLTASQLKRMDLFGKEVYMQAAVRKAKNMPRVKFASEKAYLFDGNKSRAGKAWDDIRSGNYSNENRDALFVLFNDLSQWQPISLSEMPAAYNTAGNMRIAYMLKSFNIKALNNIKREVMNDYNSGNTLGAAKSGMYLVAAMSLAGAGADEIKDWILGRDTEFSENVYDQLGSMFLMNRFTIERGLDQGKLLTSLVQGQMPPLRYMDFVIDDMGKWMFDRENFKFKSLQNIPVVGKIGYAHTDAGMNTNLDNRKRDLYEKIRENARSGSALYAAGVRKGVEAYNDIASDLGEERLKYKTLKNVRKKEVKKMREAA
jgi:hypothetical protein